MTSQQSKAKEFKSLHEKATPFVLPNPWDAGSAALLEGLGFKALATTSAGFAQSLGRRDGQVSLEEKLIHCRSICAVTHIPVTADFENGFADAPEVVSQNLIRAAEAGVVGASIEDFSGESIYELTLAVERIEACVSACRSLDFPFMLTARAENLIRGVDDLDDTIKRLQAYEKAGAEVLYAPGLKTIEQIRMVRESISKPINVLFPFLPAVDMDTYAELGVNRLSSGGALANLAIASTIDAANEMNQSGTFSWLKNVASGGAVRKLLDP